MQKDLIKLSVILFYPTAICISLITKTSTCGWGVVIMLAGIAVYYLTKPKEGLKE